MNTRVRFAPSPTGPLHIGGVRTALFSYLYARKNKGVFLLRIEDTDQNRYVEGSEQYIQRALEWAGLTPDEGPSNGGNFGPYRQSERKEIYKNHIEKLIQNGTAYYAFDNADALNESRKKAEEKGDTFKYGAQNRMSFDNSLTVSKAELEQKLKEDHVVRLKVEPGQKISVYDEIRGNITLESSLLDDKILMKSDGMPTYHFANVVDDKLMEISCVIRGEEWLPSLPIHQLIYDAFGWEAPQFMHLPLILKPSGKGKLSKRDGDKEGFPVFPLSWDEKSLGFKESGFLSLGFINYLALLGWNSGTEQEIFSLDELQAEFDTSGIQKGGARFDFEKAKWLNHQHISNTSAEELYTYPVVKEQLSELDPKIHLELIDLLKERLFTLNDLKKEIEWVISPVPYDEKVVNKLSPKNPAAVLEGVSSIIKNGSNLENLKEQLMGWAKEKEIGIGIMMQCLRLALVGKLSGPDLFDICKILGKTVTLKRIAYTISFFNQKT
jgi:glutamyl-tRNA synthetase